MTQLMTVAGRMPRALGREATYLDSYLAAYRRQRAKDQQNAARTA
jgi:hypothetical protein